jgi:hypothetical protein
MRIAAVLLAGFAVFVPTARCSAQTAQTPPAVEEVLRLVPDDMTLCIVAQDLRGYSDKIQKSSWYQAFTKSPLGVAFFGSPEFERLTKLEQYVAEQFKVTWPQLRDDIFGDAAAFAFRHGGNGDEEYGLFLLKARDPKLLAQLVERINREQEQSGELTKLVERIHEGLTYVRRVEKHGQHFYALDGPLLVFTGKEEVMRRVLALRAQKSGAATVLAQVQRAGATQSFLTLWLNPRAFDAELQQRLRQADDFEVHGLRQFLDVWQALDAIVLSFTPHQDLELVMSIQGKTKGLSPAAERLFKHVAKSSALWERFPDNALVAVAGQIDVPALAESVTNMMPEQVRKLVGDTVKQRVEALLELDLAKDLLPNVGPDWGLSISSAPDPGEFPYMVAALAVRPGNKNVDQRLFQALDRLALLATVFSPSSEPIYLKSMQQDKVHVRYLVQNQLFPRGLQPAMALKDGYLLIASHPEAIRQFRKGAGSPPPTTEALCVRISLTEISKLVRQHRATIAAFLADKNHIPPATAGEILDGVLAIVAPFDRLTISERAGDGQISVILRLSPPK